MTSEQQYPLEENVPQEDTSLNRSSNPDSAQRDTDYHSKLVMIRAERHDVIAITDVRTVLNNCNLIPESAKVVQRTDPYFGPRLMLFSEGNNYLLTAPGPDSGLLLWTSIVDSDGQRTGWEKAAEVSARFVDDLPQYEFCPQCGEPLKTLKHEKQAELGCCPNG